MICVVVSTHDFCEQMQCIIMCTLVQNYVSMFLSFICIFVLTSLLMMLTLLTVHDPRNMSFFEVDLTLNSAMIGILYLTAAMKRYEYVVSQDMLLSDQNAHRLAMNVVQQARQNQSNAVDAGRIAAARAAALEASAAYLAKRAADRAVLDARERADIARAQQQEAVRGVLDGQRHADNAAAALINARIRNLNAEAVVQLEKQKAIADKRRSEAMQHEESMRLQQKELLNELEVLKAQARHAADAAQKEGQRLQREAAQAANVAHEAWLLTPDGRAHLLAEAQKVVRERLRRQEAAERTVRLHWEQTERIRQFGEVRTIPSKAWMFIMLLLLVASGSVDFYLMWQLRPKSKGAIGKPFGALVGTAIGAEVFWSFWVWCYTAAHHSSGKPWYGQQQPAACAALYMVGYTFLFLCCSFPGLSTYAILLLFYWDTFVGSCAGNTCPFLIPGFSSYDLVAAKLFVQGLLRVVPSLAVSAVTLAAALCPLHCTPDARCVLDELQVSKLNFTDCFLHTAANSATYNGCDQTCFLDTRNRTAAIISLACAGAVLVSISWYVVYRLCSSCCCATEFDQPSDVRRQTFEEYKVAMVHFQEMRPTQHEIYNNPMFGGA